MNIAEKQPINVDLNNSDDHKMGNGGEFTCEFFIA